MVSDLTVIKHNHPRSKYPTHDSGIQWQPRDLPPVMPQGRLQKIPRTILSIHQETYQQFYVQGGGESGGRLRLGIQLKLQKCTKTLGCSTMVCLRGCNPGGQLSNQLAATIGNIAKIRWL